MKRLPYVALFAIVCFTSASLALADELSSVNDAVDLADKAMEKIINDDLDGVTEIFKPYACLNTGEFNAEMKRVADTFKARPGNFGDPIGYVLVKKELIGGVLLRVTFLEKFKRKPLQWDFLFYKPEDGWLFTAYSYHASAITMFGMIIPPPTPTPSPTQR